MPLESLAAELIEVMPKVMVLIRQRIKGHAGSSLTMPQLRILSQLKSGELSNSELADRCGIDITSMSRMADHLIKRGFLIRSVDKKDRRCVRLRLSAKGSREQRALATEVREWVSDSLSLLSIADQTRLSSGIGALRNLERTMAVHEGKSVSLFK